MVYSGTAYTRGTSREGGQREGGPASFERWRGFKSGLPERSVGVLVRAHLVVRMSVLSVVITDGSVVQLPQSAGALWRLEDPQSLDYRV